MPTGAIREEVARILGKATARGNATCFNLGQAITPRSGPGGRMPAPFRGVHELSAI